MSSEETLIQIRKDKHQQINGGKYSLASDSGVLPFVKHTTISQAISAMQAMQEVGTLVTSIDPTSLAGSPKYMLKGRITAFRKSGAITFIKLTDSTGSVQTIASKAVYLDYDNLKLFDLGDIVEVIGHVCLSKTEEKSLLAFGIRLLTKAVRPPPEKFAGIADTELKYRKRYLDLMGSEESRARFTIRTYVMRAIRDFMENSDFLEVETSTLNTIASGANAKPFTTHHNALDIDLRLRIAPELYLKRLLVGGMDRVYEIGRAYRNEGIDTRHNPEFTMMESYQAYGNFPDLLLFTKRLLRHVVIYCGNHLPPQALEYFNQWNGLDKFAFSSFVEVKMIDAVLKSCKLAGLEMLFPQAVAMPSEPSSLDIEVLKIDNPRLSKIDVKSMFHVLSDCQTVGEKIAALFEYVAEPFLTEDYSGPIFITDYPREISPLARANDQNSHTVDRFELFVDGRELANAFQELNDPEEQALRFKEQLESNNKDPMDYDADYVEALEHGMPPAIGFGIGIDRLVMLLTNTASIKDVILFPTLRPEK